jgi:hypothetical protein
MMSKINLPLNDVFCCAGEFVGCYFLLLVGFFVTSFVRGRLLLEKSVEIPDHFDLLHSLHSTGPNHNSKQLR